MNSLRAYDRLRAAEFSDEQARAILAAIGGDDHLLDASFNAEQARALREVLLPTRRVP